MPDLTFDRAATKNSMKWMDIVLSVSMIGTLIFAGIGWYGTLQLEMELKNTKSALVNAQSSLIASQAKITNLKRLWPEP